MIHNVQQHPVHGRIPLCGRAMWDDLTVSPQLTTCWECRSILGLEPLDETERQFLETRYHLKGGEQT